MRLYFPVAATLLFAALCNTSDVIAQISNVPPASVDPSAELQINSTSKGAVFPRMSAAQRLGISSPANGLLVYDTDSSGFMVYAASAWTRIMSTDSNQIWKRNGTDVFTLEQSYLSRFGFNTQSPRGKFEFMDSSYTLGGYPSILLDKKYPWSANPGGNTTAMSIVTSETGTRGFTSNYTALSLSGVADGIRIATPGKGISVSSGDVGLFVVSTGTAPAIKTSGSVGINANPSGCAALEVNSVSKGALFPRMSSVQRSGIAAPTNGLLVYDSDSSAFMVYAGNAWTRIMSTDSNQIWKHKGDDVYVLGRNYGSRFGFNTLAPKAKFSYVDSDYTIGGYPSIMLEKDYPWSANPSGNTTAMSIVTSETGTRAFTSNYTALNLSGVADGIRITTPGKGISVSSGGQGLLVVATGSAPAITASGATQLFGTLQIADGTQGANRVLTSDASGNASWQAPLSGYTGGSGISINGGVINALDASATNELQNLSLSGSILSISSGNSVTLPSHSLSVSGTTLSISGGNSVTLPAGGGQWNSANTDDIQNGNAGRVLIGSQINAPYSTLKGRLIVRDTIAFGTGIRSYTNAAYETAMAAIDSGTSGNPRGGIGPTGIPFTGSEGLQAYSKYGDGIFAFTSNGRGMYLKGGNQSNYAMVIDTNGSNTSGNTGALGALQLNGPLKLNYGTPAPGKVLTSDANGVASWQTAAAATSYTAGSGIAITGGNVISAADNSATNEIQTLAVSGNVLSISGGNNVTLPSGATSPWSSIGGDIVRNNTGSIVAVNTSTPRIFASMDVQDSAGTGVIANFGSSSNYVGIVTLNTGTGEKGYFGVSSGSSDMDFGTISSNTAGSVNLTTAGLPRLTVQADGKVMIGAGTPQEQLEVSGALRLGYTTNTNNGTIRYNNSAGRFEGYHNGWIDLSKPTVGSYWTLSGADISANNGGRVGIGTSTPQAKLHVADSSVLFGGPATLPFTAPAPPVSGAGNRTMWYAEKAAFRAGGVNYFESTRWNKDSIGNWSFAAGLNNMAKGETSTALGSENIAATINSVAIGDGNASLGAQAVCLGLSNTATGNASFAIGQNNTTTEFSSHAFGNYNAVYGEHSTAIGLWNVTNAQGSIALGQFSDTLAGADHTYQVSTDALLTIGNGLGSSSRHNAFTMLKNGKAGFNNDAPTAQLDVKFNSNVVEPHLRLYEAGDDYARQTFSNSNNSTFWSLAAYNAPSVSANDRFILYNSAGGDLMTMTGDGNMGVKSTAPSSRMQVAGSFATAIIAKTASYTATIDDHTVVADASSAAFAITLPSAVGIEGRMYVIKRTNGGSNDVTIQADGSETIDGSNTQTLTAQWKYMSLQSDGANWIVIGNN